MKYAWFRCTDVSVHKQVFRLDYQHVGICSFFSGGYQKSVFLFSHPTDGSPLPPPPSLLPQTMAIAAVLGWDSRIYSGGNHHEGLYIGFHVRLRHHLLGSARATHPRHPSEHRSLGKHLWGHRSKCEHLAARSKHPSCVARVVGALPRDELKSAVDNGLAWVRRSSTEARPGDTKRATLGIPGKLTRELLDSNRTPGQRYWALVYHSLKPENRLAWTPWTQIISEKKHMDLLEKKGRRPRSSMEFLTQMCWEDVPQIDEASLSSGLWRINQILQIRSNACRAFWRMSSGNAQDI